MRVEDGDGGIRWIDPAWVIAVELRPPRGEDGFDPHGSEFPWTVFVTLQTGQRDCVYRHEDHDHAEAVASSIAMTCRNNVWDPHDIHPRTQPPADSRLLDEPYRHSNEKPGPSAWERARVVHAGLIGPISNRGDHKVTCACGWTREFPSLRLAELGHTDHTVRAASGLPL